MPQGSLEVSTYQVPASPEAPVPDDAPSLRARALEYLTDRIPAAAVGAVSILLHAVLITSILWGAGGRAPQPPESGFSGSARVQGDHEAALQWVILDLGPGPSAHVEPSVSPALTAAPPVSLQAELARVVAELDAAFAESTVPGTSSSSTDSTGAGAALAAMAGRYIGQINARIDRAWLRPRTPIGASAFSCHVRIDQNRAGHVLDVTLERCNGDLRWQVSLVQAIESASPLPAPPDPAVFAPIVHMSFRASAYSRGAPEWEYEPKPLAQLAQTAARDDGAQSALERLHEALQKSSPNDVINLTITGLANRNPVEGPPPVPTGAVEISRDSAPR